MKNLTIVLVLLLAFQGAIFAQSCLPEGITFTTQAQIDNFQVNYPGCTEIEGNVTIDGWTGSNITNLSGLSVLVSISGNLSILYIESMTNLAGLDNLAYIGGGLSISDNNDLTSLTGLDNLTSIGGGLTLSYNGSLTSLTGLESLTSLTGTLSVISNCTLTSLSGLEALTSIGGSLSISNNIALANLAGLDNLTSIDGGLWIELNGSLASLTGLDNIDAGSINDLTITYNDSLSTCEVRSVCDYIINPGGTAHIHDNKSGCDNLLEVAYACGHCLPGGITFNTQAQIDSFQVNHPGCTELFGNVTITGSDITDLNGLNILTSINGKLIIDMNDALASLTGLEKLTSTGGFFIIRRNKVLTNLTGLANLTSIGGGLSINSNDALVSMTGLVNLTSIANSLSINGNEALTSLSGLENIAAGSITDLYIYSNNSLSACAVQSICDYIANPNGIIDIHDNASGCINQDEAEAACEVGIDELAVDSWQLAVGIYPNPSSTQITIETSESTPKFLISIFNLNGQEVLSQRIRENSAVIDISRLPQGLYFVKLTSNDTVEELKLVKE
jgi:hypothetical protein